MIRLFVGVATALLALTALAGTEETTREPNATIRVLFIGNSYTYYNKLPSMLKELGKSASPPVTFITRMHAPGGCTLERHWEEGVAVKRISTRKWDWVVFQEQSTRPVEDFPRMAQYAAKLCDVAKEHGAQPAFFMTWARANKPAMTQGLARAYSTVATDNNAKLLPAGLAWHTALDKRPDLALHVDDNSHPNAKGSYLTACVFYAALTGRSPVGLSCAGAEITVEDAAFLQDVAWETAEKNR